MQIGAFTPAKDGGWIGIIRTLTIAAKVRFVPNDDCANSAAPAFRVLAGHTRIGDAWEARSAGRAKTWFRVRLDDPSWPEPIIAALFLSEDGEKAQLIWNRPPVGGGRRK